MNKKKYVSKFIHLKHNMKKNTNTINTRIIESISASFNSVVFGRRKKKVRGNIVFGRRKKK